MGNTPDAGASGSIILYEKSEETSGGHHEKSSKAELKVNKEGFIVFVQTTREYDFYSSPSTSKEKRKVKISVERLIGLIEEHGEAVK